MGMYAWWCAAHVDLEANIREFCLHAGILHLKFDEPDLETLSAWCK